MLLRRSLHPVITVDQDWERGAQLFAVAAVPDEGREELLLYYLARFREDPLKNVLCVARARDGRVATW